MKPDILTLCMLAMMILASTRHAIGFLTSQTSTGVSPNDGHGIASAAEKQRLRGVGGVFVGGVDDEGTVTQLRRHLDAQQRNVYDPGDDLLHALNAELGQELALSREEPDYANDVYNGLEVANKFDMLKRLEDDLRAEQELVDKSAMLMKMLEDPSLDTLPLVYVEEEDPAGAAAAEDYPDLESGIQSLILGPNKSKRSRYYRRYPWKRHNRNRGKYEPELRYACTPSKEDIFKLLVNLHENRKGNHSKTVNFCNRKRPAKAVFTNIRFLG
ncbi:uncharacterized protein LOC6566829 isoform X2 [Drosophila grimshawi]|uniref:uncharacterized protein LOC6566829 isoform X2 n=1 Tax=Drosophila grimshawi TaxID=7222 RepID=UPI000C86F379|nr:uncharacterized protein LOC6566829 isoform X2 [Drosophila grimshawi]